MDEEGARARVGPTLPAQPTPGPSPSRPRPQGRAAAKVTIDFTAVSRALHCLTVTCVSLS